MTLSELSLAEVKSRLCGTGLVIRTGSFIFRIQSRIPSIADGLALLYPEYPLLADDQFVDFTVALSPSAGIRRWWRSQVRFVYDGESPFAMLPIDHAFPLMEWAMNWCISTQAHHYLTLHAAVIEKGGHAVIMPAPPGSGKSTLCAALIHRGWRLLSDELALISLTNGMLTPLVRPVSLKNQSLQVIQTFAPESILNQVTHDTSKGSVSHMKVPVNHVRRMNEFAKPRWVVFPKYLSNAPARLSSRPKANSMLELGRNSFNYTVHGQTGFELLADVVSNSDCYDFSYSQLDDAVAVFDDLAANAVS
ncbi:MAG: HprK-related kinase A [Rhodoferax ferrireducens]|uniref:HprK-related kinase A n=1 Tax=Rhodoferax ferrireducens TaxID=192843 RepID=A0A1W9KTT5_9BURK|nr:MAG: HprK-related kinase A [Rhodoferax ferrireducens]